MTMLTIKEKDTRPIVCQEDARLPLTGTVVLKVGTSTPATIGGTITDAATGLFEFPRQTNDFVPGVYPAEILFTDASGEETTETFTINVEGRVV